MKPLGTLRFLLAFAVMYAHSYSVLRTPLLNPVFPATFGVLMFFTISGYIICFTVERWYAERAGAFLFNRALRIYPTHIACYVFALFVLWNATDLKYGTLPPITGDGLTAEFFRTLLIFPTSGFTLNPPMWTVLQEMQFYAFIGIATFFPQRKALYWTGAMAICLFTLFGNLSYDEHRMSFVFFALGGSIVYFKSRWSWPVIALAALAVSKHILFIPSNTLRENALHLLIYAAMFGVFLILLRQKRASRADVFLGNLSYPLYACHYPVLMFIGSQGRSGLLDWLIVAGACLAASAAIFYLVERPIAAIRARVRAAPSLAPKRQLETEHVYHDARRRDVGRVVEQNNHLLP